MLIWRHHMFSDERAALAVTGDRFMIGRSARCDVALPSPYVPPEALVVERNSHGWVLQSLGVACEFAGMRIDPGVRVPLHDGAELKLRPFVLRFDLESGSPDDRPASGHELDEQIAAFLGELHENFLAAFSQEQTDVARDYGREHLLHLEHVIEELAVQQGLLDPEREAMLRHLAGHSVRNVLINRVIGDDSLGDPLHAGVRNWVELASAVAERESDLQSLATRIERRLGVVPEADVPERMAAIDRAFWTRWNASTGLLHELIVYLALREVKKQMKDVVFGYGPIEDLLRLPTISEIMVVGHDQIFVEKRRKSGGTIENSGRRFVSPAATLAVIERIVSRCNRRIDQSQPMVDARLDDGSRVNAVVAPIAVSGPCLTIRKFPGRRHRIQDWIDSGGLPMIAAKFLQAAVAGRKNILVAGGTGAGKTTLLNCLADWIAPRERVVTIEDTAELQLQHDHVVQLQTKLANAESAGAITARDLVRNALRMWPDRIIVGECRGPEALDMLVAMNTGHDGSLTTLHANSPREVVTRLESMVKIAVEFSESSIHRQIASALDVIVQVERRSGAGEQEKPRIVTSICEVRDVDPESGQVEVVELYAMTAGGAADALRPTGRLATFSHELIELGLFDLNTCCLSGVAAKDQQ